MLKNKKMLCHIFFLLVFCIFTYCHAASLSEDDLGRIVYIKKNIKGYPAGSFFVFMGYDENDKMCFMPFSGAQKKRVITAEKLGFTDYYKDSHPYEIALDAYNLFAAESSNNLKFFNQCVELLRVMGKVEYLEPLLQAKAYRLQFQKQLLLLHQEFNTKKEKEYDRHDLQDYLNDEFDIAKKDILSEIDNIIDQQLSKRNILTAAAIYLHMKKFIINNKLQMTFIFTEEKKGKNRCFKTYISKDLFADSRVKLIEMINRQGTLILNKLKERYSNQPYKDKFTKRYPNARGLWSESAPTSLDGLGKFMNRFYQVRRESSRYSPISELEQWGNCRLSLLLCTSGFPEAKYLEDEFLKEFRSIKKK